jgi:hypothetical protein
MGVYPSFAIIFNLFGFLQQFCCLTALGGA